MPHRIQFNKSKPVKNNLNSRYLAGLCEYRNAANQASRSLKTRPEHSSAASSESWPERFRETFPTQAELRGRIWPSPGNATALTSSGRIVADRSIRQACDALLKFEESTRRRIRIGQSGRGVSRAIEAFPRGLGGSQHRRPSSVGWPSPGPAGFKSGRECQQHRVNI